MSLEQLANLGEFLGGLAVIFTLIYLAVQIRQNTRSIRASTLATNTDAWAKMLIQIADPGTVDAYLQGSIGKPDLAPREFLQFFLMSRALFVSLENQYQQYLDGTLDEEIYLGYERSITTQLLTFRGFRRYWQQNRMEYTPQFRTHVDGIIEREPEQSAGALMQKWQNLAAEAQADS